ncbi:RusA family crossover junction endodeoxyribonuclease [Acetobacter thailandicus]|uniref:RusA family crossover junction endodeoxyribonuclease n=1 Tax=Acetobacter thailandicus TaxID=1502842 RepID=UPI00389955A3
MQGKVSHNLKRFERNQSHYEKVGERLFTKIPAVAGQVLPVSRPDIDNQMKTAADALNRIMWNDDVQIVDAHLTRRYGPQSMTVIEVRPL